MQTFNIYFNPAYGLAGRFAPPVYTGNMALATPVQPPEPSWNQPDVRAQQQPLADALQERFGQPQAKPSGQWWPETHRLLGPEEYPQPGDIYRANGWPVSQHELVEHSDEECAQPMKDQRPGYQVARLKEPQAEQPQWPPVGWEELDPKARVQTGDECKGEGIVQSHWWVTGHTVAETGARFARPIPHYAERQQWAKLTPTEEPGVRVDAETGIRHSRWTFDECDGWIIAPDGWDGEVYEIRPLETQQEATERLRRNLSFQDQPINSLSYE